MIEPNNSESSINVEILKLLELLVPLLGDAAKAIPKLVCHHERLTRAALAKSFEFCVFVFESPDERSAFFSLSALRSICEDVISLKYFYEEVEESDREKILGSFLTLNILDGVKRQSLFFSKKRPFQPVVDVSRFSVDIDEKIKSEKSLVKSFKNKYRWRSNYPNVEEMARVIDLEDLYSFLYAATSRTVHFTPHVLERMGWTVDSISREEEIGNIANYEMKYSTSNFGRYHQEFCEFYSIELFLLVCSSFSNYLSFSSQIIDIVQQLLKAQSRYARWPEIITFEEMNLRAPSSSMYSFLEVLHRVKASKLDADVNGD